MIEARFTCCVRTMQAFFENFFFVQKGKVLILLGPVSCNCNYDRNLSLLQLQLTGPSSIGYGCAVSCNLGSRKGLEIFLNVAAE